MLLYHGTNANFDKFSLDFIGTGAKCNSEGVGIYFSDSKDLARTYAFNNGRVFTIKWNGNKAISSKEVTLSREEVRKFLVELHKRTNVLENFNDISYYGYEAVLEETVDILLDNDNDIDIVGELSNTCGSDVDTLDVLYNILGYDHAVVEATWGYDLGQKNIYIAFTPDIIEVLDVENCQ